MLADIVILSADIFAPDARVMDAVVDTTIFDGKVVYTRPRRRCRRRSDLHRAELGPAVSVHVFTQAIGRTGPSTLSPGAIDRPPPYSMRGASERKALDRLRKPGLVVGRR